MQVALSFTGSETRAILHRGIAEPILSNQRVLEQVYKLVNSHGVPCFSLLPTS